MDCLKQLIDFNRTKQIATVLSDRPPEFVNQVTDRSKTIDRGIGGYIGRILRVDLMNERISEEVLDVETLRKYVGGTALGAKYLDEEVPPGVEWSDPENRIMFFTGSLSGTIVGSGIFYRDGQLQTFCEI
jgi:hypothetical protein